MVHTDRELAQGLMLRRIDVNKTSSKVAVSLEDVYIWEGGESKLDA